MGGEKGLVSTATSAWAVWRRSGPVLENDEDDVVISGPPVELGKEEGEYVRKLGKWWEGIGEEGRKELVAAGGGPIPISEARPKSKGKGKQAVRG